MKPKLFLCDPYGDYSRVTTIAYMAGVFALVAAGLYFTLTAALDAYNLLSDGLWNMTQNQANEIAGKIKINGIIGGVAGFISYLVFWYSLKYASEFMYGDEDDQESTYLENTENKLTTGFVLWLIACAAGVFGYISEELRQFTGLVSPVCQLLSFIFLMIWGVRLVKGGDAFIKKLGKTFIWAEIIIIVILLGGTVVVCAVGSALIIPVAVISGLAYVCPLAVFYSQMNKIPHEEE